MAELLTQEISSQAKTINLIAAANYLTAAVAEAMAPELESIHCEGYPQRRYHEGQAVADSIEELAITTACTLFGFDHANVQPYRGTMANLAVCMAVMEPGDSLLGLCTAAGGHYTTGSDLHLIGRMFNVVPYDLTETALEVDYEALLGRARGVRPRVIFCGDTAYPRQWDYAELRGIADDVGAVLVADLSQYIGLVAGGVFPSPSDHVDIVTAATYKTLRGPRSGLILAKKQFAAAIDRAVYPVCQGGTNVRVLAGLAVALEEASQPEFAVYVREVLANSQELATSLAAQGFDVVTGGTDNHACMVDVRPLDSTGERVARWLSDAGILSNGNQIPFDPNPPRRPSGIRFGTSAVTTLGARREHMRAIADVIGVVLNSGGGASDIARARQDVLEVRRAFGPVLETS